MSTSASNVSAALPGDWTLNERQMCDLEMLLEGAFAPLQGFMNIQDYQCVLDKMALADGSIFPLPVVLAIPKSSCGANATSNVHWMNNSQGENQGIIKLRDSVGCVIATLNVESVYAPNLEEEMQKVLGTTDPNHPYVAYTLANHSDCFYVGGSVSVVTPIRHFNFEKYRLPPAACRSIIKQKGYDLVVGFQTRNPLHRCHYELIKQSLKIAANEEQLKPLLFLSPVVGPTQPDDVPYHLRVWCYEHVIKEFTKDAECKFDGLLSTASSTPIEKVPAASTATASLNAAENHMFVLIPLAMRMAGPRECVLHALIRRNYGCTHFIVGRDHAGPSSRKQDGTSFYGPYDAHTLLDSVAGRLGIKAIFGQEMVHVQTSTLKDGSVPSSTHGYVSASAIAEIKSANPQADIKTDSLSGTEFRRMLIAREAIPEWFSFPKVIEVLQRFYKPNNERGICVYFTGLPCSGKSTLANSVCASLLENRLENRRITILDADIVRQHLSKGLGFSREDRSTNVRRIGYLASEITKHGGICLVANIAPYACDRAFNRNLIEAQGGLYVEVYVSTPLAVCEGRDVKNLYKKARQGLIKQFTGISDPYEMPSNSELIIDSSTDISLKCDSIMNYFKRQQIILSTDESKQVA